MKQVAAEARTKDHALGLVPTMGALHEGHLSLVREAKRQCSPVVVSIFVNPTQFGPSEDFKKYPRTLEADRAALASLGVDYIFAPSPEEMYPAGFSTGVVVDGLSERLEGRSRPGHFRGVATVVLKLFEITQPRFAFFGRKDAQQLRIIHRMVTDLNLGVEVVDCAIVREADGLALSSRNAYLNGDERRAATALYRALDELRQAVASGERNPGRLVAAMHRLLDGEPGVKVDYADIVDADTFEPAAGLAKVCYAAIAARVGSTRLIDNTLIEPTTGLAGAGESISGALRVTL
jgi:pantoate--beta-alanine ligase